MFKIVLQNWFGEKIFIDVVVGCRIMLWNWIDEGIVIIYFLDVRIFF